MASYNRRWAKKYLTKRADQEPAFDPQDPISQYAAQLERELAQEDDTTTAGKFQKNSGVIPQGTMIALEYVAVYSDGTKLLMGRQTIDNVILQPGADLKIEGMTFRITS